MKKTIVGLSVASALAMAGAMPVAHADDEIECDGVLVQSRFALANCMLESVAAIAAAVATQDGCNEGAWQVAAIVPEWYEATIPIQGYLTLGGNDDALVLTGQSSAMLQNNLNCQVATTDAVNTFAGREVTYAAGSGNYYIDAIIDKDENLVCLNQALSAANITVEGSTRGYREANSLTLHQEDGEIVAEGALSISVRKSARQEVVLSTWELTEEVIIPALGATAVDGFEFEAYTDDIGGSVCEVKIEADVENLLFRTSETTGGLTIAGTLTVEVEVEE